MESWDMKNNPHRTFKMRTKLILISTLAVMNLATTNFTFAMYGEKENEDAQGSVIRSPFRGSNEDLKSIGKRYLSFMKTVISRDIQATQDEIHELFTDECEKIENGTVLFKVSSELSNQLANARKAVGNKPELETLWMTASSEDQTCTIQFKWWSEMMPAHTTMVTLFVNNGGKIFSIREVFNKFQTEILGSQKNEK